LYEVAPAGIGTQKTEQDALWTASRKIDTFRGAAAFGTWLYRITANTANQKLRGRRSRRNEVSWQDLAPSFDDQGQYMEVAVDWSRRLKDPAIEGELRSVLGDAIDELPADYRTAFLLHDVEGLPYPEIAATLHLKLGTAKSRVHRTRLFLQRRLADYMGASPKGEAMKSMEPRHRATPAIVCSWRAREIATLGIPQRLAAGTSART
jgi:RNA polymerase sigma-70 factor, ECF subfamily